MPEIRMAPSGLVVLIDTADLPVVEAHTWYPRRHPRSTYARANGPTVDGARATILMHRLIMAAAPDQVVDHRNGDGLDNRRANLRVCTKGKNNQNARRRSDSSTGYKGVSFYKANGQFMAYINASGRRCHLGYFPTAEDAAHAYNVAASLLHGEHAHLNDVVARNTIDSRVRAVLRERAGQLSDLVQDPRIVAELLGGTNSERKSA